MSLSDEIKAKALQLGFDACGIAKAELLADDAEMLQTWLKKGYHANMSYLENHFDKRTNPQLLVHGAQSVVVVLLNYFPDQLQPESAPQIAKYAYGKDIILSSKKNLNSYKPLLMDKLQTKVWYFAIQHPF